MADGANGKPKRGLERILSSLQDAVEAKDYYLAHQVHKTLAHRYVTQSKPIEALDSLYKGACTLLKNGLVESGMDLANRYLEITEKNCDDCASVVVERVLEVDKMHSLMVKGTDECKGFTSRAIKVSLTTENKGGHPSLHRSFAHNYWKEKRHDLANYHFLYSMDGESCGMFLAEYHSQFGGSPNEMDMFIAQAVLQQLCLKHSSAANVTFVMYTTHHPELSAVGAHISDSGNPAPLRSVGRPFVLPLLNFISFLLTAVNNRSQGSVFDVLCRLYESSLERDPMYHEYLRKIACNYFGMVPPKQPTNFFTGLMNSMFAGGNDEASTADTSSSSHFIDSQPSTSQSKPAPAPKIVESDLD